jgi:hypothetical protein
MISLRTSWSCLWQRSSFINRNNKGRNRLSHQWVFTERPPRHPGWFGHRSITSPAVYTALAPNRFKDFRRE